MRFIALMVSFLFALSIHAEETASSPEFLIKIMNHCYEDENKIGAELAECILDKMRNVNNPHQYHALIRDENFSKTVESDFSLVIYDKYGDVLVCKGIAKEKIVFKKCDSKKIPNFDPNKLPIDMEF
ncbi:hypothetical protein [Legionella longbeachae]|nr:hypothetical protein [Legionella longbeachae]VEE02889.1 Uncharacterised protein [Legionella oakridgensis]HBD7398907.1 hypothetical protein [Legionella pneumophila]ARB90868.1 hypothetical protein A6J40_01070 [Legionella longbeachae]ARM32706.1 hypothetical protein B0B39_03875 [Legionella longbeachae]EEZ94514.1 conserved hypothetical protein [Legionella longbeachae D-4968]